MSENWNKLDSELAYDFRNEMLEEAHRLAVMAGDRVDKCDALAVDIRKALLLALRETLLVADSSLFGSGQDRAKVVLARSEIAVAKGQLSELDKYERTNDETFQDDNHCSIDSS